MKIKSEIMQMQKVKDTIKNAASYSSGDALKLFSQYAEIQLTLRANCKFYDVTFISRFVTSTLHPTRLKMSEPVTEAGQLGLFPSRPPSQLGLGSSRPGQLGLFFYLVKCYIVLVPYVKFLKHITKYVLLLSIRASNDLLLRAFSYIWISFCVYCYKAEPKSNYT